MLSRFVCCRCIKHLDGSRIIARLRFYACDEERRRSGRAGVRLTRPSAANARRAEARTARHGGSATCRAPTGQNAEPPTADSIGVSLVGSLVIPEPVLAAVGENYEGRSDVFGVAACLILRIVGVLVRPLGFEHRQRAILA